MATPLATSSDPRALHNEASYDTDSNSIDDIELSDLTDSDPDYRPSEEDLSGIDNNCDQVCLTLKCGLSLYYTFIMNAFLPKCDTVVSRFQYKHFCF